MHCGEHLIVSGSIELFSATRESAPTGFEEVGTVRNGKVGLRHVVSPLNELLSKAGISDGRSGWRLTPTEGLPSESRLKARLGAVILNP
jgi:hypothetical protein